MEEDWDVSRAPRSEEVDLFDQGASLHSGSSGSSGPSGQKAETSEGVCGPGEQGPLMSLGPVPGRCSRTSLLLPAGAKSLLSEDLLSQQDLALLAVLDFLCLCASVQPVPGLLFKPQEVRRRLLLLLQQVDFSRPLHLSMVGGAEVAAAACLCSTHLCLPPSSTWSC